MRSVLTTIGKFLGGILALATTILFFVLIAKLAGKFFASISSSMPTLPSPTTPSVPPVTPSGNVNWDWIIYILMGIVILFFVIRALAHEGASGKKSVSLILVSSSVVVIFAGLMRLAGYQVVNKIAEVSPSLASVLKAIPFGPEIGFILFGFFLIFLIRGRTEGALRKTVDILTIASFIGGGIWIFLTAGNYFIGYIIPLIERMWQAMLGIPLTKNMRVGLAVMMIASSMLWKFHSTKWLIWMPMVVFLLLGASIIWGDLEKQRIVTNIGIGKFGDVISGYLNNLTERSLLNADRERRQIQNERRWMENPDPPQKITPVPPFGGDHFEDYDKPRSPRAEARRRLADTEPRYHQPPQEVRRRTYYDHKGRETPEGFFWGEGYGRR